MSFVNTKELLKPVETEIPPVVVAPVIEDGKPADEIVTDIIPDKDKEVVKSPEEIEAERIAALPAETEEEKTIRIAAEEKETQRVAEFKSAARKEFLAEMGFESEDDIVALKTRAAEKPLTEEEKLKKIDDYNKDLTAFAIKEGFLANKDISEIESIKGLEDQDIALRDFAAEYRADNKGRKDETTGELDPVTEEEITEEFNKFYHIDSSNNTLRGKGEKMMKQVAEEVRKQSESKLATAKAEFDIVLDKQKNIPLYQKFVQDTISESIPTELTLGGEGESKVVFKLVNDKGEPLYDLEKIKALFVDNRLFNDFIEGKDLKGLKAMMSETVTDYIEKENRVAIRNLLLEQGKNAGRKEGSVVGSKVPFETKEAKPVVTSDKELSTEAKVGLKKRFGGLSMPR